MLRTDSVVSGRYRLRRQIAEGGMGTVWEARDERLDRRVALKTLHPQPGLDAEDAQLVRDRAMREARITARLHHPNAVPVYDVVDDDGRPCLIMQFLPSRSLSALIGEFGRLPVPDVARIGAEVGSALAAAHAVGIVHRDVKPGNVLIDDSGTAKITDFGISHALGDVTLTSTGMVTGTPAFLAPEVARGEKSAPSSDVFSLGATLYAAAEGAPPFGAGANPMATLHRVASGRMDPPRSSGPLTPLLLRMLSLRPGDRPTMAEAVADLQSLQVQLGAADHLHTDESAAGSAARAAQADGVAAAVPPATTVVLPPAGNRPAGNPTARPTTRPTTPVSAPPPVAPVDRDRPPRRWLIVAVVAVVLVGAAVAAIAASLGGGSGGRTPPAAQGRHRTGAPGTRTTRTSQSTTPKDRHSPATHHAPPPPAHHSAPTSHTPAPPPSRESHGAPTADQLASAIEDYYALLPGDTNAAWSRLTPSYQNGTAENRGYYDRFWSQFSKVEASGVSAQPPHSVVATITYTRQDGSVQRETDSFELVRRDGELQINDSRVVSG